MPRESAIQRKIRDYAKSQGCKVLKLQHGLYGEGGQADLLILIPVDYQKFCVPCYIEVKKPGEVPGPRQESRLREYRRYKAWAMQADNVEVVVGAIRIIRSLKP